jgi:hypothetical protein
LLSDVLAFDALVEAFVSEVLALLADVLALDALLDAFVALVAA